MDEICAGLTVVELGSGSPAGAIAGMVLADAGARVIKVEAPGGDTLRVRNPSGFLVWNRGKESVVADLDTAAGGRRWPTSPRMPTSSSTRSRPERTTPVGPRRRNAAVEQPGPRVL